MNELVRATPEEPAEKAPDATETGLVRVEQEKTLEKDDIDTLWRKAGELHGINEVQQGLELSIVGAGLQVMADRYGADKLLEALQSEGTFQKVIEKLAPETGERETLYEAIKTEPIDALAERLNDTLGGVAYANQRNDGLARFRHFEVMGIQGKTVQKGGGVIGSRLHRHTNKEGRTDSGNLLLTGDFNNLLKNHPDLIEDFRESNDTLTLLKDIREIYETEYSELSSDLEQAKAAVEEKIAEGEAGVAELQTLADDIYSGEIANLEEKLAATSNEDAQAMIQGMLDKKAAEIATAREELKGKMEAVRGKVVKDLGAGKIYGLHPSAPAQPRLTHHHEDHRAA